MDMPGGKEVRFIIPLRRYILKYPRWKRAARAVRVLRTLMQRYMKHENIKISEGVNKVIWSRGAKHPPAKIEVYAKYYEEEDFVLVMTPEEYEEHKLLEAQTKEEEKKEEVESGG